jgi:hypothetical protein
MRRMFTLKFYVLPVPYQFKIRSGDQLFLGWGMDGWILGGGDRAPAHEPRFGLIVLWDGVTLVAILDRPISLFLAQAYTSFSATRGPLRNLVSPL